MVNRSDLDVFNVDSDGTLLAATYTGATFGHHFVARSPLLLSDVFFDTPPQDGRDLIGWIRCHSVAQRDRAIETQARMAHLMQAQSSYRVVQVDSSASGPLTPVGLAQAFQERIGVIATREFSADEVFRRAAHSIEDDSSPAVKRHIRHLKEDK